MLILSLLLASVSAHAASPTLGIYGGYYGSPPPHPYTGSLLFAGRAGVQVEPAFDVELDLNFAFPKNRDDDTKSYFLFSPRVNALWHLTPEEDFDFFVAAGPGLGVMSQKDGGETPGPAGPWPSVVVNAGPGLNMHVAGPLHIRTDLRWAGSFGYDSSNTESWTYHNLEWTVGLNLRQSGVKDTDGDGIGDKDDACVNEAEDADGFEDADGCPDADNDKDGLADTADSCRDQAEDIDGFADTDGCPELDNDNDGIADAQDGCPMVNEDKDNFEDTDGCPDNDNDKDQVSDQKDQCINEPETRNGYRDLDGCPDEVPQEVKKYTGAIKGITFETNKTIIRKSSEPTLQDALKVLNQFPEVKLEIQGHTDDQGDDAQNLVLSQGRADAVRDWFVQNGIAADRLTAKGYGETVPVGDNKTPEGREQNRRVEFKLVQE